MSGLSQLLETARRALMSQQVALGVTSHNIANASTPGYSRQRAELVPTMPLRMTFGFLGTGVDVQTIGRMRDSFIDQQIRNSNGAHGQANIEQQVLSQVEANINEPSDVGLSSALNGLFNAFQDLSVHPEESSSRNAVLQKGTLLTQSFHQLSGEITSLRTSLSDDVNAKVDRINMLTQEVSDLDVQITNGLALGQQPNDAMDQRDQKLEELSNLINITVSVDNRGSVMVAVGGNVVASRAGATKLTASTVGNQIAIVTDPGGVPVTVTGGELGGTLKSYNTSLPDYQAKLDTLAGALITRVNTLHAAGFGLGTPPPTGVNFFSGSNATDIGIDPAVAADTNNIAASSDGTPGDNGAALALSGVVNENLLNGNSVTVNQYYNGLVSQLGSAINSADNTTKSQELVFAQLDNQRTSVSGVSLDEEMTNMIKFQRAFDAAARIVTTADSMFQSILNMVA